jgi:hypothetical protein
MRRNLVLIITSVCALWVMSSGHGVAALRNRRAVLSRCGTGAAILCAFWLGWPGLTGSGHAELSESATITPVTPFHLAPSTSDSFEAGRTDDPSPAFLVQGSWDTLTCELDDRSVSCGSAPVSCAAPSCTEISPGPLKNGAHDLSISADDFPLADYQFDVDLTPPKTFVSLDLPEHVRATRPGFSVESDDDDDLAIDTTRCSLTSVTVAPEWTPCSGDGYRFSPPPLPARHIDYVFRAQATDDFGRASGIASLGYDPVPCVFDHIAGMRVVPFERRGIPFTLRCSDTKSVDLKMFLLGENGHLRPLKATERWPGLPMVGELLHTSHRAHFVLRRRFLLFTSDPLDLQLKHDRSATFALQFNAEDVPYLHSYAVFTVRP